MTTILFLIVKTIKIIIYIILLVIVLLFNSLGRRPTNGLPKPIKNVIVFLLILYLVYKLLPLNHYDLINKAILPPIVGDGNIKDSEEEYSLHTTLVVPDEDLRSLDMIMENKEQHEGPDFLSALYNNIYSCQEWLDWSTHKFIFSHVTLSSGVFMSPHNNSLVSNDMTKEEFYSAISPFAPTINSARYSQGIPEFITVKSWKTDIEANRNLKGLAKMKLPLAPIGHTRGYATTAGTQPFSTLDIETINVTPNGHAGEQLPVMVTLTNPPSFDEELLCQYACVSPTFFTPVPEGVSLKEHIEGQQLDLWSDTVTALLSYVPVDPSSSMAKSYYNTHYIWVHNLSFDGIFLIKYLNLLCEKSPTFKKYKVESAIDSNNKFIYIKLVVPGNISKRPGIFKNYVFLDSYRVFPYPLKELGETFKADTTPSGEKGEYNPLYNNYYKLTEHGKEGVLFKEFKEYALTEVLYYSMAEAQYIYFYSYEIDITKVVSTSTLAMKIYLKNYLPKKYKSIPKLKPSQDAFIRSSYHGGSTDIYKKYGENLYYYDVNSLYPMKQPLPVKINEFIEDIEKLEHFFGFCTAKITCTKDVAIPILPRRTKEIYGAGVHSHPTGEWTGIYFSEELKAAKKLGYKIIPLNGYEFEKGYLFNDFIDHFYNIKKNSSGSIKAIAKLCLNSLYGFLGRSISTLKTLSIKNKDISIYLSICKIKNIVKINKSKSLLLIDNGLPGDKYSPLNLKHISNQGITLNPKKGDKLHKILKKVIHNKKNNFFQPQVNVALASAITAYARIYMQQFKTKEWMPHIYYTDTDSIFIDKPIDPSMIGPELGLMKNEMEGISRALLPGAGYQGRIDRAYFLGLKQYAYQYTDLQGETMTKSTFAGVKKNSLNWNNIIDLSKGQEISYMKENIFSTNLNKLNVNVTNKMEYKLRVKLPEGKSLEGNNYMPREEE